MSPMDLIDITHFQLANGRAIFNAHSDPAWLLVAAGCAKDGFAVVLQGSFDDASRVIPGSTLDQKGDGKLFIWFGA